MRDWRRLWWIGRLGAAAAMLVLIMAGGSAPPGSARPLPNLALPTLGGLQFWADRYLYGGWRLQENVLTGHVRLLDPANIRRCWGRYETCRAAFERMRGEFGIAPYSGHLVVLLHGLGRSRDSMTGLESALRADGWQVATIGYPSTRRGLAANADRIEALVGDLEGVDRISFVTHSLGGLLVRELLSRDAEWRHRIAVDSAVMIAPPNQGAAIADALQYVPPINLVLGHGLLAATAASARRLPVPDLPIGIVAAGRGGIGYNPFLPGDDDLLVRIAETRLDGAADWVQVHSAHTFAMDQPETVAAVENFLRYRRFTAPESVTPQPSIPNAATRSPQLTNPASVSSPSVTP